MRAPPIINTDKLVRKKQKMLEELGFITIASKVPLILLLALQLQLMQSSNKDKSKNPVDAQYDKLNTELVPLDKNSKMYKHIYDYVKNTHGPTHDKYKLKIKAVFEVIKYSCSF